MAAVWAFSLVIVVPEGGATPRVLCPAHPGASLAQVTYVEHSYFMFYYKGKSINGRASRLIRSCGVACLIGHETCISVCKLSHHPSRGKGQGGMARICLF
ncbi:hypothetical protein B0H63DRAFT_149200 [Podospora didyma]|uniref:Secreted protein n=1 Tax=Podospora didyma TaxID=330526 RepID=A0AAE0U162_9PEZI|nr:hypothetical protein B0H63DRAFT_149200 [Podospora didyma]